VAPSNTVIWFLKGSITYSGGGEKLLLEGIAFFNKINIDTILLLKKKTNFENIFNGRYSPYQLSYECEILKFIPLINHLSNFLKLCIILSKFKGQVILANNAQSAFPLILINIFKINKIKIICFIHGSFYQFSDDLLKYSYFFKSKIPIIFNLNQDYKLYISVKRPRKSVLTILKSEITGIISYIGGRYSNLIYVLSEKNRAEITILYKNTNVKVLKGAFALNIYQELNKVKNQITNALNLNEHNVIFSLSRLVEKKRVDLIIKAFAISLLQNKKLFLIIGGTGQQKYYLQNLVAQLGISESVFFAGFIDESDVLAYYNSCNVFISADLADFDITAYVALACAKKIIVPKDHEFSNELLNTQLVVRSDFDIQKLAETIIETINKKPITSIAEIKLIMYNYSWENYFTKISEDIYKFSIYTNAE